MLEWLAAHLGLIIFGGLACLLLAALGAVLAINQRRYLLALLPLAAVACAMAALLSPPVIIRNELLALARAADTRVSITPQDAGLSRRHLLAALEHLRFFYGESSASPGPRRAQFELCAGPEQRCQRVSLAEDSRDSDLYWVRLAVPHGEVPVGFLRRADTGLDW
jgi:hypothetical protein